MIAYRAGATGSQIDPGNSVTVTVPSAVVVGDVMLLFISRTGDRTRSTPSGWTFLRADTGTGPNPAIQEVYWRVAVSGDPSSTVTVSFSGGSYNYVLAQIQVWSGTHTTPINAHGATTSSSSGTSLTAPSVTTTVNNAQVVECFSCTCSTSSAQTISGPSTVRGTVAPGSLLNGSSVSDQSQSAAGATGGTSATAGQSGGWVGTTVALAPAASPDVTVTGAVATLAVAAPAGSLSISASVSVAGVTAAVSAAAPAGGISFVTTVAGPAAALTAQAPAGSVQSFVALRSWTADDSQKVRLRVTLDASLNVEVAVVNPPSHYTEPQIRARRLSLVMPTPSLDSRGRPT